MNCAISLSQFAAIYCDMINFKEFFLACEGLGQFTPLSPDEDYYTQLIGDGRLR